MMAKLGLLMSVVLLCCIASVASADVQVGFEEWFGHNCEPVANSIMGLSFGTTENTDVYFADINAKVPGGYDWYSLTSDNGKVSGDGEYFISGDMAAYVLDGDMKISLTDGRATTAFTVGVSNLFDVVLQAYDTSGTLISGDGVIGTATGAPNTKTQPTATPGTALQYLTVNSTVPNIAYVVIHSEPGFYMVDNISYVIPEPAGILSLMAGLAGLLGVAKRTRRK